MAIIKVTRTMRETPNGTPMDAIAHAGAKVDILEKKDVEGAGAWVKIKLVTAPSTPEGWISADAVDAAAVVPDAPIDKALFAKECWRQSLYTGTNAHYLAALAELRSRIRTGLDSNGKAAPFKITKDEWGKTLKDDEFQLDFLPDAFENWRQQCAVFAVMTLRKMDALMAPPNEGQRPSALALCIAQSDPAPADDAARNALRQKLNDALDATRSVVLAAGADVLADAEAPVTSTDSSPAQVNFGQIPAGREEIAKLIVSKFKDAGYGPIQQIAALANAIAESNLNPKAVNKTPPEHSVGLFQLNINGGLGSGHSETELKIPGTNIDIIIKEAKKFDAFKNATSLFAAVDVFVRKVEKPANQGTEVQKRTKIAERLKGTQSLLA